MARSAHCSAAALALIFGRTRSSKATGPRGIGARGTFCRQHHAPLFSITRDNEAVGKDRGRGAQRDVRCPRCNGYDRPQIIGLAHRPSV